MYFANFVQKVLAKICDWCLYNLVLLADTLNLKFEASKENKKRMFCN